MALNSVISSIETQRISLLIWIQRMHKMFNILFQKNKKWHTNCLSHKRNNLLSSSSSSSSADLSCRLLQLDHRCITTVKSTGGNKSQQILISCTKIMWFQQFLKLKRTCHGANAVRECVPGQGTSVWQCMLAELRAQPWQSSPSLRWKTNKVQSVVYWHRRTGRFASGMSGCDSDGLHEWGNTAWTLFNSFVCTQYDRRRDRLRDRSLRSVACCMHWSRDWQLRQSPRVGSTWHCRSYSNRTPIWRLHFLFLTRCSGSSVDIGSPHSTLWQH